MNPLLASLKAREQTGSKARCHLLTHGGTQVVADRLTSLIRHFGSVSASDKWMPQGFANSREAQLHNAHPLLTRQPHGNTLKAWWLAAATANSRTPNWDIASTCMIGNKPGLLLVEAKAHDVELQEAEQGKPLKAPRGGVISMNRRRNHARIGACIEEANMALASATNLPWTLSRDRNYQMSNRFAWAWKLTTLGFPVLLVYLAFRDCSEMSRNLQSAICSHDEWKRLVLRHSEPLFSPEVWNKKWKVSGQDFIPLIRSRTMALK